MRLIYKNHYKALFFLGLPIVIGQVGVIVLGFADTLMIGHHSTNELGAASFVNNMFTLAIIFSTGFSYGLTPIVGGFYGVRGLEEKGFLAHHTYGNTYQYYAVVSESDFSKRTLKSVISKYFNNSYLSAVSSLVKEEDISLDDLKKLIEEVEQGNDE